MIESFSMTIHGFPRPKARPRKGKYGNFYSPTSKEERDVAWEISLAAKKNRFKRKDNTKPLDVHYAFFLNPTGKKGRYPDATNLEAFYNDAIEKSGLIDNDRKIFVSKREYYIDKTIGHSRVEILIMEKD